MRSLAEVRSHVLDLHKTLIDAERREYERSRGRLQEGEFLKALLEAPELAWLKPLTALIVRLDGEEALDFEVLLRGLLTPDDAGTEFQRRYAGALQRSPDAVVAHGRMIRALKPSLYKELP